MLGRLDLTEAKVIIDAIGMQKEIARKIKKKAVITCWVVKGKKNYIATSWMPSVWDILRAGTRKWKRATVALKHKRLHYTCYEISYG